MTTFSFYDLATGDIHPRSVSDSRFPDAPDPAQIPEGHAHIAGAFDHASQRIDLASGLPVDFQPPQPSADHEWNESTKRWQLNADAQAKIAKRTAALARIAQLEVSQHRAIREAMLDPIGGVNRLRAIDDEIKSLRPSLSP